MLSVNKRDIAIITVKNVDYRCLIHNISKSDAINLLKNSVFEICGYIYKNIVLNFGIFKTVFFNFFCLIHKMVDIMDIYKSLNISIGTAMKNPEMLTFFPDHHKTKTLCKYAVKKLP